MTLHTFLSAALAAAFVYSGSALAQDSSEEAAVWAVIESTWDDDQRGDNRWMEDSLADDFMGWPNSSPAPMSKSSAKSWSDFFNKHSKGMQHELYPLSIVVHGDMAVAHYLYRNVTEDDEGDMQVSNGRYTDIFVREDGSWKFIAWHGGDDPDDD